MTSAQLRSGAQPKQQVRHSSSLLSLAQQQSQDIKPALLSQSSHAYRQRYTYKDKFHALRERYDQVFTMNEALKKELAVAQSKQFVDRWYRNHRSVRNRNRALYACSECRRSGHGSALLLIRHRHSTREYYPSCRISERKLCAQSRCFVRCS